MSLSAAIKAISYYLPPQVVNNSDLNEYFKGQIAHNTFEKLGVEERHIIDPKLPGSYLALQSALKLFEEHSISPSSIDALIYCSVHHDFITPPTSCVLQHKLGLRTNIPTYDLTHGCSGYTYSLSLAKSLIYTFGLKNVLLLTSSVSSKYIHINDKASRLIFGDAGSATLIEAVEDTNTGIQDFVFGTDGGGQDAIIIRNGGEAYPVTEESKIEQTDINGNGFCDAGFFMNGHDVLLFTLQKIPTLIADTLAKNNLTKDDLDLFVLHQANKFMIEQVRNIAKIEEEKFYLHLEHSGNTVQATIPIALKAAMAEGKIKKGSKVLVAGFGVGLSWSATIIKF